MMFNIRKATKEDAAEIAKVHVDSWRTTYKNIVSDTYLAQLNYEDREKMWRDNSFESVFVAEDQSGIFGFAGFGPERTKKHNYDGELYAIYLFKEKQKMGAGKALVKEGVKYLLENGYQNMLVWVLDENPSIGFYLSLEPEKVAKDSFTIAEKNHIEIAFGWRDLSLLEAKLSK